jgi:predicted transcriptional regulator of viral defense system
MIISTSGLRIKYNTYANPLDKIKRDTDQGYLVRLNRALYETNNNVNPHFLASSILSPSYLSFDWALAFYGLIPEKVI